MSEPKDDFVPPVGVDEGQPPEEEEEEEEEENTKKRIHFEVFGKVQGVFFRKFTQQQAIARNVTGWCRNTETKTVEGEAQAEKQALQAFVGDLHEGSPKSRVDRVDTHSCRLVDGEEGFLVTK